MRQDTLQEQYNRIVEGKGDMNAFHKQALRQFPNLFTAQSSFDQVVTVLKQKSIISEMVAQGLVSNSDQPNFFEIFNTNMALLAEEAKAEEKKATKEVTDLETKGYDYKNKKSIDNQSGAEFLLGFYVESRDAKNVDKTVEQIRDIVTKNLAKDPLHYVKDGQFGIKGLGYKDEAPGLGKTKEVTGKYKSSGMEPVKLSEGMYGSSDGDYDADQESRAKAEMYYDKGLEAYSEGDYLKADQYYKLALKNGSWLGWTEQDLPPYGDESLKETDITGIAGSEDEEDAKAGVRDLIYKRKKDKSLEEATPDYSKYSDDALTDMIINLSRYEDTKDLIKMAKDELEKRSKKTNKSKSSKKIAEAEAAAAKKAVLPNKQKGIASQIDVKSALEKIIQKAWAESNLDDAKKLVSDFISSTNIKSKDTILRNLDTITSKSRLDAYLANSLLSFERLGVKEIAAKDMPTGAMMIQMADNNPKLFKSYVKMMKDDPGFKTMFMKKLKDEEKKEIISKIEALKENLNK
jgi:hypothetical protein